MAKTYNNLYSKIYDFDNLYNAYLRARKNKRYRQDVIIFSANLEENLISLQNELIWKTYRTGKYRIFKIFEPKEREVAALPFRDRVVQHALISIVEPVWEKRFIHDSYACRPGKGTHAGADRAQYFLRKIKREHGKVHALKADIAKYFASIDHGILQSLIRKRIVCCDTLRLIDEILASTTNKEDAPHQGIPIGNLTSQLWANAYLHELDEFVKYQLKERFYLRYMDDFVIVHESKQHLQDVRKIIEAFLHDKLRLKTNAKTQVFPVSGLKGRALDFLGYRIWTTHRKLRKDCVKRMKRNLNRLQRLYRQGRISAERITASITSWVGHSKQANTYNLRKSILRNRQNE